MSERTQQSIASGIRKMESHLENLAAATGRTGADMTTATLLTVALTETSTEVLSANTNRAGASFINLGTQDVYLLLGEGTASATSLTVKLAANGDAIYELPYQFQGPVQAVWAGAGTGNLKITII